MNRSTILAHKRHQQGICRRCSEPISENNQYCIKHRLAMQQYQRDRRKKQRVETIAHYSNGTMSCACCKDTHLEFLAIDHINGGGTKHRNEAGWRGANFYYWLALHNFPSGYQVLCHNCNYAKTFYGKCPHQEGVIDNAIIKPFNIVKR